MSDSLRPHGLYSPWNSPGQNTGVPFPSPGGLPNPEIKPRSPALQADSLPAEPQGKLSLIQVTAAGWELGSAWPPSQLPGPSAGMNEDYCPRPCHQVLRAWGPNASLLWFLHLGQTQHPSPLKMSQPHPKTPKKLKIKSLKLRSGHAILGRKVAETLSC